MHTRKIIVGRYVIYAHTVLDDAVTRRIFVLCQGKKAFYGRSVLLWYSTGIKSLFDADRGKKDPRDDTV